MERVTGVMKNRPRIVSLCPSNTELVHALGLSDCLVGIDNYSDYPPNITEKVSTLGPDLSIDIDKMTALKPDLVLASLSVPGMEKVVDAVAATGFPHLVLSPHRLADIYQDLLLISEWLNDTEISKETERLVEGMQSRVHRVQNITIKMEYRPVLYWEWWPSPVFSPARDNWLTEISYLAGARNLFSEVPGNQVQDDGRRVVAGLPDFFLAVWTGIPQHKVPMRKLLHRPDWENIPALVQKQVYVLSEGLYCRPSPRLIDGLEQLVSLLYPQQARSVGIKKATDYAPIRDITGRPLP